MEPALQTYISLRLLSKPTASDFSQKDFSVSHILFFLERVFFLFLLCAAQEAAVHSSSVMNIYRLCVWGSIYKVQSVVMTVSKAVSLSLSWWELIADGFISAHICLSCSADAFLPRHWFSLELQESTIPWQRCTAFLGPVWLPLNRFSLAEAQEVWVLGRPWGFVSQGTTGTTVKTCLSKRSGLALVWLTFSLGSAVGC